MSFFKLLGSPTSSHWEPPPGYSGPEPGSYPGQNGHSDSQALARPGTTQKLDTIKKWSISTYKCTRQYLSEKFGKGTRTVDSELESQIQVLRDTQHKYQHVLKLSKQMNQYFYNMVQTQKHLADAFADLGMKSPELQDEFNYNSETQRSLVKNGEILLGALSFFTSNLTTLVNKTMEDSIMTVKAYEIARIEYDAYRADVEAPHAVQSKAQEAKMQFEEQREKFNRLRGDLSIKLRFLEENKVLLLVLVAVCTVVCTCTCISVLEKCIFLFLYSQIFKATPHFSSVSYLFLVFNF